MTAFVCDCGMEVHIEFEWNGVGYRKRFFTFEGQEVSVCPGCGENLYCLYYERKVLI